MNNWQLENLMARIEDLPRRYCDPKDYAPMYVHHTREWMYIYKGELLYGRFLENTRGENICHLVIYSGTNIVVFILNKYNDWEDQPLFMKYFGIPYSTVEVLLNDKYHPDYLVLKELCRELICEHLHPYDGFINKFDAYY